MSDLSMLNTPILFIIFNRPSTTKKVFEAIRLAKPSRLFIAADAPRENNNDDLENCAIARAFTEEVDWPCDVKRLYHKENLGCSLGPRTAFSWFFSQVEEGILLEDDCLPNPSFFRFCSEMLDRYRHDKKIISINGCNLGYELTNGDSYTFSRFMNMWGWATWRRSAEKIDYTLQEWKGQKRALFHLYRRLRQHPFDFDFIWYKYWKHKFDLTVENEIITWWDWQWIYHQTRDRQYSIVPGVNLVKNLGFGEHATHTKEVENPAAQIQDYEMNFPLQHPKRIYNNTKYEERQVKWVWCYHRRIKFRKYVFNGIKNLLRS